MAATSSKKTMSPFLSNLRRGIFSNWKLMVLIMVMDFLFLPLLCLNTMKGNSTLYQIQQSASDVIIALQHKLDMYESMLVLNAFCGFVVFLLIIVCALQSFSYLVKKSESDVYFALPLSRNQRFLSDYCSGMICWLLPSLISLLITFCIYQYNIFDVHCNFSEIWKIVLLVQVVKFDLYNIVVFVMQVSGKMQTVLLNAAMIMAGITLLCMGYTELLELFREYYGDTQYQSPLECIVGMPWLVVNSVEYLTNVVTNHFHNTATSLYSSDMLETPEYYAFYGIMHYGEASLYLFIHSAALFVLSWLSHRLRKAESVSKAFPLRVWKFIWQVTAAIAFSCVFCIASEITWQENMVFGFVVAVIALTGIELMIEPNFKKLIPRLVSVIGTSFIGTAAVFLALKSDMFGMGNVPPTQKNLKSIVISHHGSMLETVRIDSPDEWDKMDELYRNSRLPAYSLDAQERNQLVASNVWATEYQCYEVEYCYQDGSRRMLNTNFKQDDMNAFLDALPFEVVYAEKLVCLEKGLADQVKIINAAAELYQSEAGKQITHYIRLTEEQQKQMKEAYIKDLKQIKPSEIDTCVTNWSIHAKNSIKIENDSRYGNYIEANLRLMSEFTNSLNVLKEWGVQLPEVEEFWEEDTVELNYLEAKQLVKSDWFKDAYDVDWLKYANLEEENDTQLFHNLTKEEFAELLPYLGEYNCYYVAEQQPVVYINSYIFLLNAEGQKVLAVMAAK